MRLTVLGASGSYPGPGRACSGYLVESGATALWVDAGSGTLANLQRHVSLHDVDAVLISHRHPDHCRDLEGFYIAAKYYVHRDSIPVYAPADVPDTLAYRDEPLSWTLVTDGDTARIGDITVTFARTDHPADTMAMRFSGGGKALGYSADAGPGWSLAALGPGLDLALCDATVLRDKEGKVEGHMSARQAATTARDAGVSRLVLTHLAPGVDPAASRAEAEAVFAGPVTVAVEHESYEL